MINYYKPEGSLIATPANREYLSSRKGLEKAMAQGIILEDTALLCDGDMNLHIDLHGILGIMPRDEVVFDPNGEPTKDIAIITRVGKPLCFKVLGIHEENGRIVAILSRRQAQIDCYRNYISTLIPGDIVDSRVTHLESFGAFVDVGCGIISLLCVDCISVSRISHPKDRLFPGMSIRTVIKSIDKQNNRIFVSTKELLGTWEENADMFVRGQTVAGIIRSIESYGVFVELTPNLAGLAELRDGFILNDSDAKETMIGKLAAVYIKNIIPERMKIKLVLVDSYKGECNTQKLRYFTDENVTHIDYWKYSPDCSDRIIESIF